MNNEKCQKEMKKLIKQKIKRKKRKRLQKLQVLTCRGEREREREREREIIRARESVFICAARKRC